jgi:hypothetical protein
VIGKKLFSEFRFLLIRFDAVDDADLDAADDPRQRRLQYRRRGTRWAIGTREIELAQNFDSTVAASTRCASGCCSKPVVGQRPALERLRHLHVHQRRLQAGTPRRIRFASAIRWSSTRRQGRMVLQDDFRPCKTLQLSAGLRQEVQTQVDSKWNFAPRGAFTWNATKKTTVRGGYGIFYDWYDSALYEQTIRVDGTHQIDVIVQNPGFPVIEGGGNRLPASIIRSSSLDQPIIQQASIGLERPLAAWADFRTDYMWTRGSNTLRSINVNAPVKWRPPGSDGRQHHRDPVERQARLGSLHRWRERALHPAPHPSAW